MKLNQAPNGTGLAPVNESTQVNFQIFMDGERVHPKEMVAYHSGIGVQVVYGEDPMHYDGFVFHERGGGGSVILPFTEIDDALYVGLIEQMRYLMSDEPVLNAVAGMLEAGKSHFQTAEQELKHELGYVAQPVLLPGEPANPNSTWFETNFEGEGIRFFAIRVSPDVLEYVDGRLCFKQGVLQPSDKDLSDRERKLAEKILGAKFLPWTMVAELGDMKTLSAITRLMAYLQE